MDNGSTDGTASLIRPARSAISTSPKRGVSNARNRGIAESTGEILAFVDADCLVEPQWLTELVRPFEDPEVGASAGDLQHVPATTAAERQAARLLGNWQRFAFNSNPAYPITANAAYRRDVLERIGPFDPHMTRAQDVELGLRFQERSGRRLAYAEAGHRPAPQPLHADRLLPPAARLGLWRRAGRRQVRGDGRRPGQAAPDPRDRPHRARSRHRSPSREMPAAAAAAMDRGRLVRPDFARSPGGSAPAPASARARGSGGRRPLRSSA